MLDGRCRECLTEGWACLWGRVGDRGEEAKVLHREGRGQRGPGCVWGEGSQEGRGNLPPSRRPVPGVAVSSGVWAGRGVTRIWL